MKHAMYRQQPKTLSLAVSAALTGIGLAMTLVVPARADTIISSRTTMYTNATTQNITVTGNLHVTTGWPVYGINNTNTITTLLNNGSIYGSSAGVENGSSSYIGTLTNTGTLSAESASDTFSAIRNAGSIGSINNSNLISVNSGYGIYNTGTIGALTNTGTIQGGGGIFWLGNL